MGRSVEYCCKMKTLLIFATVLVAVRGQGPEGGEGSRYAPNAAAPSPGGGNYDPCKCQCVFPAKTYKCGFRRCGNCLSTYRGRKWCYVDGIAANACGDTRQSDSGKFWSWEACTTPTIGSSQCPYK